MPIKYMIYKISGLSKFPVNLLLLAMLVIVVSIIQLNLAPIAQAQTGVAFEATDTSGFVPCGDNANNPCTIAHLFAAMIAIINYLIATSGFVAVAMIVFSGLKMVTAHGDQSQLAEAKSRLSGAIIGVVLVSLAFLLINSLFSGSLSLGIKDGALILTNPIEYIRGAGQ